MIDKYCIDCENKVVWTIFAINLGLFLLKGMFGLVSHSKSLLADALQSLANLIITVVVLVSLRIASRGTDNKFPYGYGKMEFLASGVVNTLLMFGAIVFVIVSFGGMLIVGPEKPPGLVAIVAAGVSIAANYIAFGYGRCVAEKSGSMAIMANAMVSRADMGTSAAVIVAVLGANLGFAKLDHIAAIVIGVLVIKVTLDGVMKALKGLMDSSLQSEELHIRNLTEEIEGVERVGDVRARRVGRSLWVDMNVFVPADWVLTRGLETVRKVKAVLYRKMEGVSTVSVQLMPADGTDEEAGE